jgi:hypothetical protein
MPVSLPYSPKFERKFLEKSLSKRYFKKPYDRFMWWRSYTPKNKPLTNRHPFLDRIKNGDFDTGPYLFEAMLAEHKMNEKFIECLSTDGEPDYGRWNAETSIDRARIKRLNEDHEKEEFNKLFEVKKNFLLTFKMTSEQYENEVTETNADDLVTFYMEMKKKYGTYWKPMKKLNF